MLEHLKANNRAWAERKVATDADFFQRLERQQAPQYLWIGCSDSRVPANEIVGLDPGELFVHRNVANLAPPQDANYLSVLQFAVDVIKVKHILVVGHYGCGGVAAALHDRRIGIADNWIRHVHDVRNKHREWLDEVAEDRRLGALCELNVLEQALNVCETTVVQDAWARDQSVVVHGWVYGLHDGLLKDLNITAAQFAEVGPAYARAMAALRLRYA